MSQASGKVSASKFYQLNNDHFTISLVSSQTAAYNDPASSPVCLRPQSLQSPSATLTRHDPQISWSNGDSAASVVDIQQIDDLANNISFDNTHSSAADSSDSRGWTMEREDPLAVAQNGASAEFSDDEVHDDNNDQDLDDDMMDRISSSPSIEDEDIDFDFVYALHTFVATVEGQANAVKGEPMMLLDDSNSYWWLVRVVKDSTIGYLPAEHIETPTERLARLNKHRNLDLSAAMLGDPIEPGKSKKGLGVLRRRKTVAFAAPTYVDYEKEYSSESDAGDEAEAMFAQQQAEAKQQREEKQAEQEAAAAAASATTATETTEMEDESAKVKPLATKKEPAANTMTTAVATTSGTSTSDVDIIISDDSETETAVTAPTIEEPAEKSDGVSRSRNGTVRNTDSFYKDDSVETKKITLTPNLLRDDSNGRVSSDSANSRTRPSLDNLEKDLQSDKKDDKKKKDKKPGGLRGFFSRKEKKKSVDEDSESTAKRPMDTTDSRDTPTSEGRMTPQRTLNNSKLHKQTSSGSINAGISTSTSSAKYVAEAPRNDVSNVPPASMRVVEQDPAVVAAAQQKVNNRLSMAMMDMTGPQVGVLTPISEGPVMAASVATSRMELDSDSADEDNFIIQNPVGSSTPTTNSNMKPAPLSPTKQTNRGTYSPLDGSLEGSNQPPALITDNSSQDDASLGSSPSPDLGGSDESGSTRQTTQGSSPAGTGTEFRSSAASTVSTWNDEKLRTFFESSSDIRDMLVVVYDKSDVIPAGPEHPIAGPLFREQNAKLAEITTQLDHMLGDWLARKQRTRGAI